MVKTFPNGQDEGSNEDGDRTTNRLTDSMTQGGREERKIINNEYAGVSIIFFYVL